jgi:hypothetical protein
LSEKKSGRAEEAGKAMADYLIEFIHLMYQRNTAMRVFISLIHRLQDRIPEFKI